MATASQTSSLPDPALHLGLVRLQVKRFKACYRWIPADDFYTARRYDPARGTTFATYAMHWIKREMHREIIAEPLVRLPSYLYSASRRPARDLLRVRVGRLAGLGEVEPPAAAAGPEAAAERRNEARAFETALAELPDRWRRVVTLRLDGMEYRQIGRAVGCCHEQARQDWFRARDRLRDSLRPRGDQP